MNKTLRWITTIVVLLTMAFGAITLVNTSIEIVHQSAQRLSEEEVTEQQDTNKLYDRKMVQDTFSKERPSWTKVMALIFSLVAIPLIPLACLCYTIWSIAGLIRMSTRRNPKVRVYEEEKSSEEN